MLVTRQQPLHHHPQEMSKVLTAAICHIIYQEISNPFCAAAALLVAF
jgi:hypothetical protein